MGLKRFGNRADLEPAVPFGIMSQRKKGSQHEEAAYLVDKAMGHFGRVPPSIHRKIGNLEGSLTLFVPALRANTHIEGEQKAETLQPKDYRKMAILDHTLGNLDRHSDNWLLCDQGSPIPIDHNFAFPKKNGFQGWHNFDFVKSQELESKDTAALEKFQSAPKETKSRLRELLGKRPLEALEERVASMLETGATNNEWRWGDGPSLEGSAARDMWLEEQRRLGQGI